MTTNVRCARPDDSLGTAAEALRALNVGALPVCDNDRLAGIVTDRDIVIRGLANGGGASSVRDVMTDRVIWCYEDEDADAAARIMAEEQIRRLPVLNRDKRLVGIVSLGDLATRTNDVSRAGHTLESISEAPL